MVLAVPSPANGVAGVDVTAAFWNAQVRDAVTFLANPPLCVCYAGAAQSIPNGTWTSLLFSLNRIDSYSGHSVVTNTSRYTAQVPGWYSVGGTGVLASSGTNNAARIAVNGTVILGTPQAGGLIAAAAAGTGAVECDVFLNLGDYVEVQFFQSSGGAINTLVTGTDFTSLMHVRWVHI